MQVCNEPRVNVVPTSMVWAGQRDVYEAVQVWRSKLEEPVMSMFQSICLNVWFKRSCVKRWRKHLMADQTREQLSLIHI